MSRVERRLQIILSWQPLFCHTETSVLRSLPLLQTDQVEALYKERTADPVNCRDIKEWRSWNELTVVAVVFSAVNVPPLSRAFMHTRKDYKDNNTSRKRERSSSFAPNKFRHGPRWMKRTHPTTRLSQGGGKVVTGSFTDSRRIPLGVQLHAPATFWFTPTSDYQLTLSICFLYCTCRHARAHMAMTRSLQTMRPPCM